MEILLYEKKALRAVETPLYTGWEPAPDVKVIEGKPKFTWKGAKIPFALWSEMVCFLRWSQLTFKEEAMMTLFYNPESREWAAWPFPQEPAGMTIRLLHNHPLYATDRQQFGSGWLQAGSIHHHCNAGAFQSGTDTSDEMDRDGVHITLGKMEENVLDTHIRQVFDGLMGDSSLLDWIDVPQFLTQAPAYLRWDYTMTAIRSVRNVEFPEVWKSRIIERPKGNNVVGGNFQVGHQQQSLPLGPRNTTIITGAAGKTTESAAKKSTRNGANHAGTSTTSETGGNWETLTQNRLSAICDQLGITITDAFMYLACERHQQGKLNWTAEDFTMAQALKDEIKKTPVPILYAEAVFERMLAAG